jgi:hypothetical protein
MGNFSRNTFSPVKSYVAVRLQRGPAGAPLVDADWNEAQDVTRHETYAGLQAGFGADVCARDGFGLTVIGGNDLMLSEGTAIAAGRPVQGRTPLRYSTQLYADRRTALRDRVQPVTPIPLTQPSADRLDAVYLDVFEREVTSREDPAIVDPAIGIETATRLRREIVLRVAEGTGIPAAASGHVHVPIAALRRNAEPLTAAQIEDARSYPPRPLRHSGKDQPQISVAPVFQPAGTAQGWAATSGVGYWGARKPASTDVAGWRPVELPDGVLLGALIAYGEIAGDNTAVEFYLGARSIGQPQINWLCWSKVQSPGAFVRHAPVRREIFGNHIIDNAKYWYLITAGGTGPGTVDVRGLAVGYEP